MLVVVVVVGSRAFLSSRCCCALVVTTMEFRIAPLLVSSFCWQVLEGNVRQQRLSTLLMLL